MDKSEMLKIFTDTDYVHRSGTEEELRAAEYLKARCEAIGVPARIEGFRVPMAEIEEGHVYIDGQEIEAKPFFCCGSGEAEGEIYFMPAADKLSISGAKDKIVLMDQQGVSFFTYQDLMEAGAKAILFRYGNVNFPNGDIDERDLREQVVGEQRKVLCAMIHTRTAAEIVKSGAKTAKLVIRQREYDGESHNVIAEIPGARSEYITLTAHYDTTALSHGAYDNMSGCVGLLGVMDALKDKKLN